MSGQPNLAPGARPWTREEIARRAASRTGPTSTGIGLPTRVADWMPQDREVFLHSENGILHLGPRPPAGRGRRTGQCQQAAGQPAAGRILFDSALSFAMMRGGHLDTAILGAYEVAANGDLANWTRADPGTPPAVGGAMELAFGARAVWVLMEHTTRDGRPRLRARCSLPLTAAGVVRRIYTDRRCWR